MPMPVNSCPKCGAMIVPQLARCRQCKTFLQGTRVEGFLLDAILPASAVRAPATATLVFAICLVYALMVLASRGDSLLGFSAYTLQSLGATHGPSILRGQWWRLATSIFVHHDLIHLLLNLSSLVFVGQLVESIFDRKKMLLIYLVAGIGSMLVSHLYYVYGRDQVLVVSAGASGAICGMIGAAFVGARKLGPRGTEIASRMKRWAIFMAVLGFAMPGINNAAHFGGFALGAALAALTPVGHAETVLRQKVLSVITSIALVAILASFGFMIANVRGQPVALEDDMYPRALLGYVYSPGAEPRYSGQKRAYDGCMAALEEEVQLPTALRRCELSVRANPDARDGYLILATLFDEAGDRREAEALRQVARRL